MSSVTIDTTSILSMETSILCTICEQIDTPRSLAVYLMAKYQEWEQYLSLTINEVNYGDCPRAFALDYLVTEISRKSTVLPINALKEVAAIRSFFESEELCRETNERFRNQEIDQGVIYSVSNEIFKIVGVLTHAEVDEISTLFKHGSGATTGVKGQGSVSSDKFDKNLEMTADLIPFYKTILGENWHSYASRPHIVEGSGFTTVPKNARTDRGICIEPTLNMYVQLGIGTYLKKVLKRSQIDLTTQEKNRYLASQAQVRGLATIDLSQASDSISWECVRALLPHRWFELLDLSRSKRLFINGQVNSRPLEKFSSMGNGFTFELESLIFSAVVRSVVPPAEQHNTVVFGDDIILPKRYANAVIDVLEHLGFRTNISKSFLAGRFYESCGSDWFNSTNVRPFYFRCQQNDKHFYAMQIANRIRLYCKQLGYGVFCDDIFRSIWVALYKSVPKQYSDCRVPEHFGDSGFIMSLGEGKPRRNSMMHTGYKARILQRRPIYLLKSSYGLLFSCLSRLSPSNRPYDPLGDQQDLFTGGREPKRGYLRRLSTKFAPVFDWGDGLLWDNIK